MLITATFYLLAAVSVLAALMVVIARNPVRSVMFLILTFFSVAGLFVLLGAEFLAMVLVMVYVGAVAVLFLFVVMMLDIDRAEVRQGFLDYLPLGGFLAAILLAELVLVGSVWGHKLWGENGLPAAEQDGLSNVEALGRVLYTDYIFAFQAAGLVLLVAMVGAIVLTLQSRPHVKRQDVGEQTGRRVEDSVVSVDIPSGRGLES